MSEPLVTVEVLFLWHHHQPDYRSPADGRALLPWVRLHASKDYLDMALHLERHPQVRAAFNFVPSLLDQLEEVAAGKGGALFDLLARPVESLTREEKGEVIARCATLPRHALERWPEQQGLQQRLQRRAADPGAALPADLLAAEVWFLLAWIDPMFQGEPEAQRAIEARGAFTARHRDDLLALGQRLSAEVLPAYRRLAERGQIELSASPYYHPILPLLVDLSSARRARPDLALPAERLAAPEDAARQIGRALERHARTFGARPRGMWPPEGGVSPEAAAVAAKAGIAWLASDEGVLWRSLPADARRRERLYRPWMLATADGEIAFFFRDRELSDRIGFVYQNWDAAEAAADLLARLRRIGAEHAGPAGSPVPLVTVILDGENCWEQYADDGAPFLEALYSGLEAAHDIRTRTPSEVLAGNAPRERLPALHSGSWIDADFHIWIGHPEKNRAWDLAARTRRALVESGKDVAAAPRAWEALDAACGSDWFWWFGDDHSTPDQGIFDRLFREHLQAVYRDLSLKQPPWLSVPVVRVDRRPAGFAAPLGFVHPAIDGRPTQFYEWYAAGRFRIEAGGGAMHRGAGTATDLYYGFDAERLYLRLDFAERKPPQAGVDLALEIVVPRPMMVRVKAGEPGVVEVGVGGSRGGASEPQSWAPLPGAECSVGSILELALPFAGLGLAADEAVEMVAHLGKPGAPGETLPPDDLIRFAVPGPGYELETWSA